MDALYERSGFQMDMSIGDTYEAIEQVLSETENCSRRNHEETLAEGLKSAWQTYLQFQEILNAYAGNVALGSRLVNALSSLDNPLAMDSGASEHQTISILAGAVAA
jgi:hypothetical protein